MIDLDTLPYVESPNKHVGRLKPIRLLVLHTPQTPETNTAAEGVANYFASPATGASTHLVGDNDSVIRCVKDEDTAWGAAGANADGLHYELAGVAQQSAEEWADPYSTAAIGLASEAFREWAKEHEIPMRKLSVEEVRDGVTKGICGHDDVYQAFGEGDYRSDPGAAFPWDQFIALVQCNQEDSVQRAIGCASLTPSAYITDGLTKRKIESFDELEALRVLGIVPDTEITPVTEAVFNAIPEVGGTTSVGLPSTLTGTWTATL